LKLFIQLYLIIVTYIHFRNNKYVVTYKQIKVQYI